MTQVSENPPVTFVDDPKAPEVFASFMIGAAFDNPNIRMTFVSTRVNHESSPGPVNNVANLRVVMSIPSAIQMVKFLTSFLAAAELNATQKPQEQTFQ